MSSRKLRVLVCGSTFGQFYLAALRRYAEEFDIVGLLATGSARSHECAARLGIACYDKLERLPADIDLACVVLRSTVMGGNGSELAQQLMARGISILQEQPIHHDEVVANLRVARQHQVQYRVGNLYPHLPVVKAFSHRVQLLKRRQAPQFIDAACASQVAFPLVTMLAECLGQTRPWRVDAGAVGHGPFQLLSGELGGIPLTLRIHNEVDPQDPDNHFQLLHQIAIGFPAGRLTLTDTQGPLLWSPRLHIPQAVKRDFDFSAAEAAHLMESTSTVLDESPNQSWRDTLSQRWPEAIAADLLAFRRDLLTKARVVYNPQSLLTHCQIWQALTQALGYPRLNTGQRFQPLALSALQMPPPLQGEPRAAGAIPKFASRAERSILTVSKQEVDSFVELMDCACLDAMLLSLQQGGVLDDPGRSSHSEEILDTLLVADKHRPLIRRWLELLADSGKVPLRAGRYVGVERLSAPAIAQAWRKVHEVWDGRLGTPEFIDYLHLNAQSLLPLMRAEQQAALLLFPQGQMAVADAVYRHTITARYLNTLIADWLMEHIASAKRPLRVLEIGAGTGATTERVRETLQDSFADTPPLQWTFSDVSRFFLINARERYEKLSWMSFEQLDIDRPLIEQQITAQSVDVMVMAGVLNNAHNSETTVRWLAEALAPGGVMLITEPTREHLEILVSQAFMMTPPQDDRQRSGLRFLTANQWCDLFVRAGLQILHQLPGEQHVLAPLGQRLFIVRRPPAC